MLPAPCLPNAELHLARREVGDHHGQLADQIFRLVGRLDAGEHVTLGGLRRRRASGAAACRCHHVFAVDDLRNAQVDLGEVIDCDFRRQGFRCRRLPLVRPPGRRLGRQGHGWRRGATAAASMSVPAMSTAHLEHLRIHALHQVAVVRRFEPPSWLFGRRRRRWVSSSTVRTFDKELADIRRQLRQHRRQINAQFGGTGSGSRCRRPATAILALGSFASPMACSLPRRVDRVGLIP